MYKYKNLKTNKIIIRNTPIDREKRRDYQLLEWRRNMSMKKSEIKQK